KPKPARQVVAYINRDCTLEYSGCGVEGVDFTGHKAEIADQQGARKRTKTGWGESNAPWGSEGGVGAAKYRLQQGPARIKNRHRSHPGSGTSLVCKSGRRVGRIHFVADALHVERYESEIADRGGSGNRVYFAEGAVEYIDSPRPGGEQ